MAEITIDQNELLKQNIKNNIDLYKYNPSAIQRTILDYLENITGNSVSIVDPTNPFIFLLEASAVNTSVALEENYNNLVKQYPVLARTTDDLYRHMADIDYLNRFAVPVTGTINLVYLKQDIIKNAIPSPSENCNKLTIPRDTLIIADNIPFSMQYPIDIRVYDNDTLQVMYDGSIDSDVRKLSANVIDIVVQKDINGNEWVIIPVDVMQYGIKSVEYVISNVSIFKEEILLDDQFFYATAYMRNDNTKNKWMKIHTTHSEYVYDINTPTVVFKLLDNKLQITIPSIYLDNGVISGNLRIDVYTTKGKLSMKLSDLPYDSYSIRYQAMDKIRDLNEYTAPMSNISVYMYSKDYLDGGRDQLSYSELKNRVIYNTTGPQSLPITEKQLYSIAEDSGFDILKIIDTVTERVYGLYKPLPTSSLPRVLTKPDTTISTLTTTIDELINNPQTKHNSDLEQVTIKSNTIYLDNNNITTLAPEQFITDVSNMSISERVNYINKLTTLYSPFYYVIDYKDSELNIRPYNLDYPYIKNKAFIQQNIQLGPTINTQDITITKVTNGYKLRITTISNDMAKEIPDTDIYVQIGLVDETDGGMTHLTATLVGKTEDNERIYDVLIETDYSMDDNNNLGILNTTRENFTQFGYRAFVNLDTDIDIIYATTSDTVPRILSDIDIYINKDVVPNTSIGITHEKVSIHFGDYLDRLWRRTRTSIGPSAYMKYQEDVPLYHKEDVYDIDPKTGSIFSFDENCNIEYNLIAKKGDPVLDDNGDPVYIHRKGDVMVDGYGRPIIDKEKGIVHHIDIYTIDGVYLFATNPDYKEYRDTITNFITNITIDEVSDINNRLLELTEAYLSSKLTTGKLTVDIGNNETMTINARQKMIVKLYTTETIVKNPTQRDTITKTIITVINDKLESPIYSRKDIEDSILDKLGTLAMGVSISGIENDLDTFTITTPSGKLCLDKKLFIEKDKTTTVIPDITIDFIAIK